MQALVQQQAADHAEQSEGKYQEGILRPAQVKFQRLHLKRPRSQPDVADCKKAKSLLTSTNALCQVALMCSVSE